jgi:hypothetical protein
MTLAYQRKLTVIKRSPRKVGTESEDLKENQKVSSCI